MLGPVARGSVNLNRELVSVSNLQLAIIVLHDHQLD